MSKISRNAPCPCGSGKKYKKCCLSKDQAKSSNQKEKSLNSQQKDEIASDIHNFTKEHGGDKERMLNSPDFMDYMNKFKLLMDNSSHGEMNKMTASYSGFYEFSKFLEEFAMAIKNGAFDDILGKK